MGVWRSLGSALRTPVAVGYLLVVAVIGAWVAVDTLYVHADASFAGIWLFVATAPTSMLFMVVPSQWGMIGVPIGALVQAAVLGAAYRGLTRGRRLAAG